MILSTKHPFLDYDYLHINLASKKVLSVFGWRETTKKNEGFTIVVIKKESESDPTRF